MVRNKLSYVTKLRPTGRRDALEVPGAPSIFTVLCSKDGLLLGVAVETNATDYALSFSERSIKPSDECSVVRTPNK